MGLLEQYVGKYFRAKSASNNIDIKTIDSRQLAGLSKNIKASTQYKDDTIERGSIDN